MGRADGDVANEAAKSDDTLETFRRRLLESDSESDMNSEDESDGELEAAQTFNWSMLSDPSESATVARPPQKQILNRASLRQQSGKGGRRKQDWPKHHVGARKGYGIQSASRVTAARNYVDPDDDLLI